jgi:citrate synthase
MRNVLTAEQVASRLGVQLQTVYAYVSRGQLTRTLADDGRKSLFDPAEVERLARRGRPRQGSVPVGSVDVAITTAITCIQPERLLYRGHDVRSLCETSFEAVAELLWTGELPRHALWNEMADPVLQALRLALPADSAPIERFALVTAGLACQTPLRVDLALAAVTGHARSLLSSFVDSLPLTAASRSSRTRKPGPSLAARLWPRLSPLPQTPAHVASLNAALVLLADHELATSTLAARVAASTRADPLSVVLAGLGALSGPLHGKAALNVHALLLAARACGSAQRALAQVLGQSGRVPGFGHPVYRGVDPRAQCLLEYSSALYRRADKAVIDAVCAAGRASSQREANVDFALAAFAFGLQMPLGATEAIFAMARSAGWIAHALEEYAEQPLRFRARALYIGAVLD